jgi:large subunit ribosomal protein L30
MAQKKSETKNVEAKAPAKSEAKATIRIQYFRSKIQAPVKHKLVIKGLGFTRLNQIVVREDTPSIRGMVKTVPHLVRIVE